jgi:hypothetical protein
MTPSAYSQWVTDASRLLFGRGRAVEFAAHIYHGSIPA